MSKPAKGVVDQDVLKKLKGAAMSRSLEGRCSAARKLDAVPEHLRATVDAAILDRDNIASPALLKYLRDECGVEIAPTTFQVHRTGRCSCDQR